MNLTIEQKEAIRQQLQAYCGRFPSQNKASESLKGTSKGTVSTILNGKFESISDDMFRHISAQIGGAEEWQVVETTVFKEIMFVLDECQRFKKVKWLVGEAGAGKTKTATVFSKERKNVFYVLCSRDMRKSDFVRELARVMGLNATGLSIRGTLELIIRELSFRDTAPLLVFDEADKLNENVFSYFIDLYNRLYGKAGMVFLSTSHIKKRITSGLHYNKEGYQEIFSRIGRSYFDISKASAMDVFSVCQANGLEKSQIDRVIKETESCDFDFRRVRDVTEVLKRKRQLAANAN